MIPDTDAIVGAARAWLGTPYRHRASRLGAGCDCLGLLRGVWRTLYDYEQAEVPPYGRNARDPWHAGALEAAARRYLVPLDRPPAAGDVVLFRLIAALPPRHCGIMVAPDRFIHAQERHGVVEANLTEGWRRRLDGAFGWPERQY